MKSIKLFIAVVLFSTFCFGQKTIKIHHSYPGASEIYSETGEGSQKTIKAKSGEKIVVEVSNAHPALYQYNFTTETIKLEEDKIDGISNLISLLSTLLVQSPGTAATTVPGARAGTRVSVDDDPDSWQSMYLKKIKDLKDEITKAKTIIEQSETPESLEDVINKTDKSGFLYAKKELMKLSFYTNSNLDKDVEKWKTDFTAASDYDRTDPEQALTMEIYSNYAQSLLNLCKEIKTVYGKDVSGVVKFMVTASDSIQVIYLSIKNKSEDNKIRERGDKIITITIMPYYNRPVLEFVPVAALIYGWDGKKYSIKNNVIAEEKDENFRFSAGGILNLNLDSWGAFDEYSVGLGAGFAIAEEKLNTFYASVLFSYKKWCRFGLGVGATSMASYLKTGTVGSALPSDVSDINDIIGYRMQPAIFFTIVIPGLTLPLLN